MKNSITKTILAGILLVFSAGLVKAAPPLITSVKQLSQNVREDIVNKSTAVATLVSSVTVLQTGLAAETTARIQADNALAGGINSNTLRIGQLEIATATLRTDLDAVILSTGSFIEFESDPIFTASPAGGITGTQVTNWDSAHSWGNHALAGYLTTYTETDPIFVASPAGGISGTQVTNWDSAFGWGNHALAGYLTSYTETDPIFSAAPAAGILAGDITNWNTAYSWGNHALAGYLTSYTETDPIFVASPANGITGTQVTNWDSAFSWGNHALAGYLTSYTETDPIFTASPANGITGTQITNWDSAFSWGNHALAGYLTSYTETDPVYTAEKSVYAVKSDTFTFTGAVSFDNAIGLGYTEVSNLCNSATTCSATCPAGTKVVGGGFDLPDTYAKKSRPNSTGNTFDVTAAVTTNITAIATCIKVQ